MGLTVNGNPSWKAHIDIISNKLSKYTGILNKLKHYLPIDILRILYCSMVQSNLNYCLLAWGFECPRLQKLQKKFIRIITCSKYNAHTEPLFKCLKLLKLDDLFKLNIMKFYFKYKNKKVPSYFGAFEILRQIDLHGRNTRHNDRVPSIVTRTTSAQKCIRNYIPSIINSMPPNILDKIETHSFNGFVNYTKHVILDSYSLECSIENCYVCAR